MKAIGLFCAICVLILFIVFAYKTGYEEGKKKGYSEGIKEELTYKNGTIYTERDIGIISNPDDFEEIHRIFQHVTVNGIEAHGEIVSITVDDIAQIVERVKRIERVEPILSIDVLSESHVEVKTGVIHGPLNGGGRYYDLKKKNGIWDLHETGYIKSWVSQRTTEGRTSRSSQFLSRSALQS